MPACVKDIPAGSIWPDRMAQEVAAAHGPREGCHDEADHPAEDGQGENQTAAVRLLTRQLRRREGRLGGFRKRIVVGAQGAPATRDMRVSVRSGATAEGPLPAREVSREESGPQHTIHPFPPSAPDRTRGRRASVLATVPQAVEPSRSARDQSSRGRKGQPNRGQCRLCRIGGSVPSFRRVRRPLAACVRIPGRSSQSACTWTRFTSRARRSVPHEQSPARAAPVPRCRPRIPRGCRSQLGRASPRTAGRPLCQRRGPAYVPSTGIAARGSDGYWVGLDDHFAVYRMTCRRSTRRFRGTGPRKKVVAGGRHAVELNRARVVLAASRQGAASPVSRAASGGQRIPDFRMPGRPSGRGGSRELRGAETNRSGWDGDCGDVGRRWGSPRGRNSCGMVRVAGIPKTSAAVDFGARPQSVSARREWLEAAFVSVASERSKSRDLVWADCEFDSPVSFVRDRDTGQLRALVGVTISLQTRESGGLESVEAVCRAARGHGRVSLRKRSLGHRRSARLQYEPARDDSSPSARAGGARLRRVQGGRGC